jgi:DNA-binding SARP family transcriptional activator/predicted ATPase
MGDVSLIAPALRLRLLGGCEILHPEGEAHLESNKSKALLVYLALNADPQPHSQPRHKLMGLFWGDLPEASARRNLRHALWDLRKHVDSPDSPSCLLADQQAIAFNRQASHWLDVEVFSKKINQEADISSLQEAIDLYRGDFLEGFYVNDAPDFEDWVLLERERLHIMACTGLQQLVKRYSELGELEAGLRASARWLSIDPWNEDAHRHRMRLLALSGQRSAALLQYETCRRLLLEELGIEPGKETNALYEHIRADTLDVGGRFDSRRSNLPPQTTPFVGREEKLAQLHDLLVDSTCRLVTITGPGGIGKTRLAVRAASQLIQHNLPVFPQGIYYVPLVGIDSIQSLIFTIAQVLHFSFFGVENPGLQLINYLSEKHLLLVLDNFEQLLALHGAGRATSDIWADGAELAAEILKQAHGVKLLVTSRERLSLQEEWVFPLEGLTYPLALPLASSSAGLEEQDQGYIEAYSAVKLFVQTARRAVLGYKLTRQDFPHVAHICQLVDGMPLAVELAAVWVRMLSCEAIAGEIERQLDFLSGPARDVPPRHHSIRAVFEQSWKLLPADERQVLQRLSVFRGGFSQDAARQVTGASLATLSALVDKSLVRRNPDGRFELHELLKRYTAERLHVDPVDEYAAYLQHCEYYSQQIASQTELITRNPRDQLLVKEIPDVKDVNAAWEWAVRGRRLEEIEKISRGIQLYCQVCNYFQMGEAAFKGALEGLGWVGDALDTLGDTQGALPWILLSQQASFVAYLGRHDQAREMLERCLPVFRRLNIRADLARSLFFLGDIARFSADYSKACEYLQEAMDLFKEVGDADAVGFCLNVLGLVSTGRKEYPQARALLEESLSIFKDRGNPWGEAVAGTNLAALLKGIGDYQGAQCRLEENLVIFQNSGQLWGLATCLNYLGDVARMQGEFNKAFDYYCDALSLMKEIGNRYGIALTLNNLGNAADDLQDFEQARQYFQEALNSAQELPSLLGFISDAVHAIAARLMQEKKDAQAQMFIDLSMPSGHP